MAEKLGIAPVNLAEYAGKGRVERRYLLQSDSKAQGRVNSIMRVAVEMTLLYGDPLFRAMVPPAVLDAPGSQPGALDAADEARNLDANFGQLDLASLAAGGSSDLLLLGPSASYPRRGGGGGGGGGGSGGARSPSMHRRNRSLGGTTARFSTAIEADDLVESIMRQASASSGTPLGGVEQTAPSPPPPLSSSVATAAATEAMSTATAAATGVGGRK